MIHFWTVPPEIVFVFFSCCCWLQKKIVSISDDSHTHTHTHRYMIGQLVHQRYNYCDCKYRVCHTHVCLSHTHTHKKTEKPNQISLMVFFLFCFIFSQFLTFYSYSFFCRIYCDPENPKKWWSQFTLFYFFVLFCFGDRLFSLW